MSQTAVIRRGAHSYPARLVDISESGVRFETNGRLTTGDTAQLQFKFPWSGAPLRIDVTIVREASRARESFTFGAKFMELDASTSLMIRLGVSKGLEANKPKPSPAQRPAPRTASSTKRKAPTRSTSSIAKVLDRLTRPL